jgi:hypothetical protein
MVASSPSASVLGEAVAEAFGGGHGGDVHRKGLRPWAVGAQQGHQARGQREDTGVQAVLGGEFEAGAQIRAFGSAATP